MSSKKYLAIRNPGLIKQGKMFRIGFVLFTIINAHALARRTRETLDLSGSWEQQLAIDGPVYTSSSKNSVATTSVVPPVNSAGYGVDTSVSTIEKNMVTEAVTSTAIASTQRESSSWWSNIFSGVVPVYRKVTSYTGPYLLPGLLVTSVFGVVGTLVCSYTSICNTVLSMLGSNVRQASHRSSQYVNLTGMYFSSRFCHQLTVGTV